MKQEHWIFLIVIAVVAWGLYHNLTGPVPASAYHTPPNESGGLNF